MIANFTEDWNEFDLNLPDYKRITNKNVCHGCWNSKGIIFDIRNVGLKLTNPRDCSTNTTKFVIAYDIRKNIVRTGATALRFPVPSAIAIKPAVTKLAFLGRKSFVPIY